MSRSRPDNLPESSPSRPKRCNGGLFRADLKAHLDGEMSAVRHGLVRWHLAQCAECREELRWLRRLGEDMKDIESARPRPELRARIMANLPTAPPAPGIRVVHSRPDQERSWRLAPRLALAGSFAMVFAFGTVFALTRAAHAPAGFATAAQIAKISAPQSKGPAEVAVAAQPGTATPQPYTPGEDPYNALANKMFQEEMAQQERARQLEGQDDWHRLLTQARAVARNTKATSNTEMGVSLAVADVAGVRAHLPGWAKQEGVTLVMDGQSASAAPGAGSTVPVAPKSMPEGMVAFYVPAEKGPAFLGELKHLGQISLMPLAPKVATNNGRSETNVSIEVNSDTKLKAVPTAPALDSGVSVEKTPVVSNKPVKAARYLVLTVLLQSVSGSRP